jgi:hypothetical protein
MGCREKQREPEALVTGHWEMFSLLCVYMCRPLPDIPPFAADRSKPLD